MCILSRILSSQLNDPKTRGQSVRISCGRRVTYHITVYWKKNSPIKLNIDIDKIQVNPYFTNLHNLKLLILTLVYYYLTGAYADMTIFTTFS